jgi:hypothetical protein
MKLETTIAARRDRTVTAAIGSEKYVFQKNEQGCLVAEVTEESHIAYLLGTGDFLPVDDEDFEAASKMVAQANEDDGEESDDSDESDDPEDEIAVAPPVEENTPPSGRKPRKVN